MTHQNVYVPKVGDHVSASQHRGVEFIIHAVDQEGHTVKVRRIGPSYASNVDDGRSWDTLTLLKKDKREDMN